MDGIIDKVENSLELEISSAVGIRDRVETAVHSQPGGRVCPLCAGARCGSGDSPLMTPIHGNQQVRRPESDLVQPPRAMRSEIDLAKQRISLRGWVSFCARGGKNAARHRIDTQQARPRLGIRASANVTLADEDQSTHASDIGRARPRARDSML